MNNLIIGDTPSQLGQVTAADAIIVDGKVVTRDDYIALRNMVYPYSCSDEWFNFENGEYLCAPPIGSIVNVNGRKVKVISYEKTSIGGLQDVIAAIFSSKNDDGSLSLGFEVNMAKVKPVNFNETLVKASTSNSLESYELCLSEEEISKILMKTNIEYY